MNRFGELGLCQATLAGLEACGFREPTPIQTSAIPVVLSGKDVIGTAETGSGKTLAFILPTLEILSRENWSLSDGLGILIITPTRELALQIFEVVRKVGSKHSFSVGLVIGGKDFNTERDMIFKMNILIATPGRLLQHLDQSADFHTTNLKLLVLDEADRILDLGFSATMRAIVETLPKTRQTLLFSATLDKLEDLCEISLNQPSHIRIQETTTPARLDQFYIACPLEEKTKVLYSFIKKHVRQKLLVFVSSCKQVRYYYEAFCKLRPGFPVLCLHGKQQQPKRISIFKEFCRKGSAVLFATDIASRGLDFPAVDWVVQLDCPESLETHIHRVGRTARYEARGSSLLILLHSEAPIVSAIKASRIKIKKMDSLGLLDPRPRLATICSRHSDIRYLAKRAMHSYIRSLYLHHKSVFETLTEQDMYDFAASLGLSDRPLFHKNPCSLTFAEPDEMLGNQQPDAVQKKPFATKPILNSRHYFDDEGNQIPVPLDERSACSQPEL